MMELRYQRDGVTYRAVEPSHELVRAHANTLRAWYNTPANSQLMGNTVEMTVDDVLEYWRDVDKRNARGFLLFVDDVLAGDSELRHITHAYAEFSIMIGALAEQGRGLGGTFAALIHVFAFRELGLQRLYVPPKAENVRVHRLNFRLGYGVDNSPEARAFADDESDVTMSITRERFEAVNAWTRDVTVCT
jgi:RimJ/RimL family protein N-acetyltransferase